VKRSRDNYGVLADCFAEAIGAETTEARAACLRVAELVNLIRATLTANK
jgi:hypothetical protein